MNLSGTSSWARHLQPDARKMTAFAILAVAASCSCGPDASSVSRQAAAAPAGGPEAAVSGRTSAPASSAHAVLIAPDPLGTAYTASDGPCRITWVVAGQGLNRGVVMHRPACSRPLAEQAPLVGQVLDAILERPSEAQALRTLQWGRVCPDGPADETVAVRLAAAAWRSAGWDARTGRPAAGDVNGFVREIANQAEIYAEPQSVFAARGLALAVASVEKVLVARAGELPFFAALSREGVPADDLVPWDAQVWLSIAPRGPS